MFDPTLLSRIATTLSRIENVGISILHHIEAEEEQRKDDPVQDDLTPPPTPPPVERPYSPIPLLKPTGVLHHKGVKTPYEVSSGDIRIFFETTDVNKIELRRDGETAAFYTKHIPAMSRAVSINRQHIQNGLFFRLSKSGSGPSMWVSLPQWLIDMSLPDKEE